MGRNSQIMGTARRTTITGVATLFDSFLSSHVVNESTTNDPSLSTKKESCFMCTCSFITYTTHNVQYIQFIVKKVILRNNGKKESNSGGMCCVIRYLSITMTQYLMISRYRYI